MSPHIGIHLHLSNFGISVFVVDSHYNDQHQDYKYQKSYQTDNSQSPDSGALKVDRLTVLEIPVLKRGCQQIVKFRTLSLGTYLGESYHTYSTNNVCWDKGLDFTIFDDLPNDGSLGC